MVALPALAYSQMRSLQLRFHRESEERSPRVVSPRISPDTVRPSRPRRSFLRVIRNSVDDFEEALSLRGASAGGRDNARHEDILATSPRQPPAAIHE